MTGTFKGFTYKQQHISQKVHVQRLSTQRVHTLHPAKLCDPVQSPATPVVLLQLRRGCSRHHVTWEGYPTQLAAALHQCQ
jgi:hypothetical protein